MHIEENQPTIKNEETFQQPHTLFDYKAPEAYLIEWQEILIQRESSEKKTDKKLVSYMVFKQENQYFALESHYFKEVTTHKKPRLIPWRVKPQFLGLIGLQGKIYPCFNLSAILNLKVESQKTRNYLRLVLLSQSDDHDAWGFYPDEIIGIEKIDSSEFLPYTQSEGENFIKAIAEKQYPIYILNYKSIYKKILELMKS